MPATDKPYTMPPVCLGDIVLWKHNPVSIEPAPALVTKVGQVGIAVLIFPTDSRAGIPKDGVRHVSDPMNPKIMSDSGVWEVTDRTRRFDEFVETLLAAAADDGK